MNTLTGPVSSTRVMMSEKEANMEKVTTDPRNARIHSDRDREVRRDEGVI